MENITQNQMNVLIMIIRGNGHMKKRTYNNILKATKMIAEKGCSWNEANEIAMKVFDEAEQQKNGMPIE